jgi:hypothetical protein
MDIQGDRWNQALNKILKRLALNEKPGFLIFEVVPKNWTGC